LTNIETLGPIDEEMALPAGFLLLREKGLVSPLLSHPGFAGPKKDMRAEVEYEMDARKNRV